MMVNAVVNRVRRNKKNGGFIGEAQLIGNNNLGRTVPIYSTDTLTTGSNVDVNLKNNFKVIRNVGSAKRSYGGGNLYHAKLKR